MGESSIELHEQMKSLQTPCTPACIHCMVHRRATLCSGVKEAFVKIVGAASMKDNLPTDFCIAGTFFS